MKAIRLGWLLLFLLGGAALQLAAQQSEADLKLLAEIRAKAEKGDAQAQFELGYAFSFGNLAVAKDEVEAVKWYRKAAEQNLAQAQYNLGVSYANGLGVAKDEAQAVSWYRKAADQNLAQAQFNLGLRYANGQGVAKDEAEAVKWYRKAAEQNDAQAQFNLGFCYANGNGMAKDEAEAVEWYRKAAEQNDAQAQNNLGACYAKGQGVPQDEAEAVKWYRKAAEQSLALAQNNLGACYAAGQGVPKDEAQAVRWYRKAVEQYRKAVEQNDAQAQFNLGLCYANGNGVAKDEADAAKWYRKAAEQNLATAQVMLGFSYYQGLGSPRDYSQAVMWFQKAAEQGNAFGQAMLGAFYGDGIGVPINDIQAYKWISLSLAHEWRNDISASTDADTVQSAIALTFKKVQSRMSREEIAQAQRLSAAFLPQAKSLNKSFGSSSPTAISSIETGTGFFITGDGYLISNNHVVKNSTQVLLVTSAGTIPARVVEVDAANDLALLKAEGKFASLPVASSRTVKMGSTVSTVGFPNIGLQGFAPKLAKGEIAALSGAQDDPRYFQISVPVQPGNSGGALVDELGNVVGVVAAKLDAAAALTTSGVLPENVNYAVKSSFLLSFLEAVPDVSARLKEPSTKDRKFEDVVKSAEQAAVLVLVY